ncbi:hypothetical protein D3C75_1277840 [compost metagenome]
MLRLRLRVPLALFCPASTLMLKLTPGVHCKVTVVPPRAVVTLLVDSADQLPKSRLP